MNNLALKEKESPAIKLWRAELSSELNKFILIAANYNRVIRSANEYLSPRTSELTGYYEMVSIVKRWLERVCEKANLEAVNVSHLRIDCNHIHSDLKKFDFPRSNDRFTGSGRITKDVRFYEASNEMLAEWIMDNFNFELLESSLDNAKKKIQGLGFKSTAKYISWVFGLGGYYGDQSGEANIKKEKGRYILSVRYISDDNYVRIKKLEVLKVESQTFEKEAGVTGLTYCLQMLINEEKSFQSAANSSSVSVPSRTKVAEDGSVSATFYKEQIKFAFEPSIFEALLSFVSEYKGDDFTLFAIKV